MLNFNEQSQRTCDGCLIQCIDEVCLPFDCQYITIGRDFNQSSEKVNLPNRLLSLSLGHRLSASGCYVALIVRSTQVGHIVSGNISRRGDCWRVNIECFVCLACVLAFVFLFSYAAFRLNVALLASWASNYLSLFWFAFCTSHSLLLRFRSFVRIVHFLTILFRLVYVGLLAHVLV